MPHTSRTLRCVGSRADRDASRSQSNSAKKSWPSVEEVSPNPQVKMSHTAPTHSQRTRMCGAPGKYMIAFFRTGREAEVRGVHRGVPPDQRPNPTRARQLNTPHLPCLYRVQFDPNVERPRIALQVADFDCMVCSANNRLGTSTYFCIGPSLIVGNAHDAFCGGERDSCQQPRRCQLI